MFPVLRAFWYDESGQGLPEYSLLVAAVVVMVVVSVMLWADEVEALFNDLGNYVSTNSGV
jgi:Flp pilus assembly pilin Flp